jgi:hypothetical protein
MNQQKITTGFVLIGTILFYSFFWKEKMGINVLIFTAYILGTYFFIFNKKELSKAAAFTSIVTLLMAIMVLANNSLLSMFMFAISFMSMVGFVHQKELKFFFYGPFQSLLHLETIPKNLFGKKDELEETMGNWKRGLTYARITILPLIVLGVFYGLYYSANPKFANLSDQTWNLFFKYFNWNISFESILFFFFGLLIVGTAIWKTAIPHLVRLNNSHSETLFRKRKKREIPIQNPKMLLLKKEFQTAVLMMGMLNILLLLVNVIDVRFVWFDFEEQPAYSLKNYVHEGTYVLIASIMLAMGIIIYYFRGNLNFYSKNKILQNLTYAWIFQNAILAYSVGMRNFRYIEYHGLAYKRIGVVIFLIAVIFGLITMFKKVQEQRSFYYLVNRNAWTVYVLLCLASLVNWDVAITRYNILAETKRPIDIEFLTHDISDKNLFLLKKYNDEIVKKLPPGYDQATLNKLCKQKMKRIEKKKDKYSWLSWNYADYRNEQILERY